MRRGVQRNRWVPVLAAIAFGWASVLAAQPAKPREESVKPGINETWKGEDIPRLVGILESEDREIYTERSRLAALVDPSPGAVVADIGAGSGFMAVEFARRVGTGGKVYAVDINPKMMEQLRAFAEEAGVGDRVEPVLSLEDSTQLPPDSVDVVFVCDTYHHFEYPQTMLRSIHQALRPDGQLIVVEFHRREGESDEWVLEHVRAGQEVFTREIEAAGFELIKVHDAPFLERNYVLRFRKPAG